jgi:hypothetical protein
MFLFNAEKKDGEEEKEEEHSDWLPVCLSVSHSLLFSSLSLSVFAKIDKSII